MERLQQKLTDFERDEEDIMLRGVLSACAFAALVGGCTESPTEPVSVEVVFTLSASFPTASGKVEMIVSTLAGELPPTAPVEPFAQVLLPFSHVTGAYQDLRLRVPARERDGETLIVQAFICLIDGSAWTTGVSGSFAELQELADSRGSIVFSRLDGTCAPPTA